jgi:hypothetical protein
VSESQIYDVECVLVALLVGGFGVALLLRWLRRLQPDLRIGRAMAVAFGIRVFAAMLVSSTALAQQLRGGDELTFIGKARSLANWDLVSTGSVDGLTKSLHVFVFSLNYRIFDLVPDMMLRVEVITFAVMGAALLAAAVHELAGRRAGLITAWILALEPANIFFSGILHKEPFMLLAEGMVAFGGAVLWKRGNFFALVPMVLGCLIATATRPYVGWFLAFGAAAIALHAGLRLKSPAVSFALITIVLGLGVAFYPAVWNASSHKNLKDLQSSQDANATDTSANLSLERVDYSTRGKIIVNLPKRVLDIATKPYPWQLGNASQQLGLLGTVALSVGFLALLGALWRDGRAIMKRAGPLIYPAAFLLVAYSLSAGNAGTAFRYRTHLVAFLLAVVCTLRETRSSAATVTVARERGTLQPVSVPYSQPT